MLKNIKKAFLSRLGLLKSESGFSLTEIVVIIAIILVVVSNLVPYVQLYIRKAHKVADLQEAKIIGETATLLLLEDKKAYDSWMYSYKKIYNENKTLNQQKNNLKPYIEDDFSTTYVVQMYRTHENWSNTDRKFFNCADSASSTGKAAAYEKALHKALPLIDIQKRKNWSTYCVANFGCRKKDKNGKYIKTTSSGHAGQDLYGDTYLIACRPNDPTYVEVYISCSNGKGACWPLYRVYPAMSNTYLALD